ncbi:MAG: hypothetical protein LBH21_08570 [Gracilibacteraceae bacterium]|jgi:hypothetical protein|nr:hypothetical protein [Gracilibacteraceae bacterium]
MRVNELAEEYRSKVVHRIRPDLSYYLRAIANCFFTDLGLCEKFRYNHENIRKDLRERYIFEVITEYCTKAVYVETGRFGKILEEKLKKFPEYLECEDFFHYLCFSFYLRPKRVILELALDEQRLVGVNDYIKRIQRDIYNYLCYTTGTEDENKHLVIINKLRNGSAEDLAELGKKLRLKRKDTIMAHLEAYEADTYVQVLPLDENFDAPMDMDDGLYNYDGDSGDGGARPEIYAETVYWTRRFFGQLGMDEGRRLLGTAVLTEDFIMSGMENRAVRNAVSAYYQGKNKYPKTPYHVVNFTAISQILASSPHYAGAGPEQTACPLCQETGDCRQNCKASCRVDEETVRIVCESTDAYYPGVAAWLYSLARMPSLERTVEYAACMEIYVAGKLDYRIAHSVRKSLKEERRRRQEEDLWQY